jgi:hydrogenase maturation protease
LTAPLLVIGIGNPSRGDDALGPRLIERLEQLDLPGLELLTDFQLQVEYALDMQGRETVVFVDAAVNGAEPYALVAVEPEADASYSSHELSPAAVLHAYARLFGPPPRSYALAIRGYRFELGEGLSARADVNLAAALGRLAELLRKPPPPPWLIDLVNNCAIPKSPSGK